MGAKSLDRQCVRKIKESRSGLEPTSVLALTVPPKTARPNRLTVWPTIGKDIHAFYVTTTVYYIIHVLSCDLAPNSQLMKH